MKILYLIIVFILGIIFGWKINEQIYKSAKNLAKFYKENGYKE